jgi:hypothetical protein
MAILFLKAVLLNDYSSKTGELTLGTPSNADQPHEMVQSVALDGREGMDGIKFLHLLPESTSES